MRCSGGEAAVGEPRGAARAAKDVRTARLSHLVRAAALLRRHSRLSCRLAAPGRLAATSSSPSMSTRSIRSSRTERNGTEKTPATSASMVVMMPVDLAAPYSNESKAECGERWGPIDERRPHSRGLGCEDNEAAEPDRV